MAYSKAYQTVTAGRVREDELGFFKLNQSVSPARTYGSYPVGGKKEPTVFADYQNDNFIGKPSAVRKPVLSAYLPNKYNS